MHELWIFTHEDGNIHNMKRKLHAMVHRLLDTCSGSRLQKMRGTQSKRLKRGGSIPWLARHTYWNGQTPVSDRGSSK